MNPIMRLAVKLAVLLAALPVVLMISMTCFPMLLFDNEYGHYRQNKEYIEEHEQYSRVLIMGDSTAKAALHPDLLSDDTYNLAVGGASSVDEYYCLRKYLEHNEAPEYVLYISNLQHMKHTTYFWSRFVYFHIIDAASLADMQEQLTTLHDISSLGISDVSEFKKEVLSYRIYAPQKYSEALFKGLWENAFGGKRYKTNMENYREAVENKGHTFYGMAEYCDKENAGISTLEDFCVDEVVEHYFKNLIRLCEENGIQFIFQSPPYNTSTHIKKNVLDEYKAYLESIRQEYPNAIIDENLCWYGPECFGDSGHANQKGMERYSLQTLQKYPDIFQG